MNETTNTETEKQTQAESMEKTENTSKTPQPKKEQGITKDLVIETKGTEKLPTKQSAVAKQQATKPKSKTTIGSNITRVDY